MRVTSKAGLLHRSILYSLAILPIASIAAPQETFLPPQRIPLSGNVLKVVVADVNGDKFDDIVTLTSDGIDVYLNEGKTRATSEDVTFFKTHIPLTTHFNHEAAEAKIKFRGDTANLPSMALTDFSGGGDLQVVDLDGDGHPDLLASNAATGEIFVLWNLATNGGAPFQFVPDANLPTDPSMTILSPLAQRAVGGEVLGTPIYVAGADLGDGSGRKSIVAYHGSLQPDPTSSEQSPFNQRNYESFGIIYPTKGTKRGFDSFTQRIAWPNCDLSFGGAAPGCVGWNDAMPANASFYNFRAATGAGLSFDDAGSDILTADGWGAPIPYGGKPYQPAVLRPNASPGLRVLTGAGANGSDSIWLDGGQQMNEFVHDSALKLMRRRTALPVVEGNERSSGSTFATLSTGQTALVTAGGMDVYYEPSNAGSVVKQPVPDFLNRNGQIGGWLGWAKLNSGSALLSLSDYCRAPDPCVATSSWHHLPLDGSGAPAAQWGGSYGLVLLDYAKEVSGPSGMQFAPFFDNPDDVRFQAFSMTAGGVTNKPFVSSGNLASPTERALVMLDHQNGAVGDPNNTHLALFRPDLAKTYQSPVPHLDGLTVGRFISDKLTDIGNSLPKGETSAVLIGSQLGVGINDGVRSVVVRDKVTGSVTGVFPVNPAENVKDIGKDGVVVPGLSTLDVGQYTLTVYNANASASMDLKIVNPFGIASTNYDWSAGGECGILPNTKDGGWWPKQIAVSVTDFPGADQLQAVRWIKSDGSVVDLPASGFASYDDASSTVTLTLPQDGKLDNGRWRPFIKAGDEWQEVPRSWNIANDSVTVELCAKKVDFVNEEAYAQCTNNDYYLDAAQYKVWPNLVNGSFRFFGSGFAQSHIQSAALRQGNQRFFSSSLVTKSDNEIDVNFGDLSSSLTPDVDVDLFFFSETGDVVQANGVPASGGRIKWRTARKGSCAQSMPHFSSLTGGSGKDGAIQAGDVVTATGENLMYPVPTSNRLILTDATSGDKYALPPRLPDDWYSTHYDNTSGKLLFPIPNDDQWEQYKIADGDSLVEDWAPPPYVSYVIEAGTTAATEASAAAWAAAGSSVLGGLVGGVYLSGNTPTGVLNFIRNKLAPSAPSPGRSADDQPDGPWQYYVVTYISNANPQPDNALYAAVFRVQSIVDVTRTAQLAIYDQGRGAFTDPRNVEAWPCVESGISWIDACMLSIVPIASPYGSPITFASTRWSLMYTPSPFFPGIDKNASIALPFGTSLISTPGPYEQFLWRNTTSPNYQWILTSSSTKQVLTSDSHDCTKVIMDEGVCYQSPLQP